jgi:hypothetical protein
MRDKIFDCVVALFCCGRLTDLEVFCGYFGDGLAQDGF